MSEIVDTGDRLSFTVFIAVAVHGLIILGVGFNYLTQPAEPPTFEVTLASYRSDQAPDDAVYQAQFNQEASGTTDEDREITTDTSAEFNDTQVREVTEIPQTQALDASERADQEVLTTERDSQFDVDINRGDDAQQQQAGEDLITKPYEISPELASLRAKLAQQQQAYAKRPRIRRLISVAAVASDDAEYLNRWRERVESVGNANFPQEALRQNIFGELRLAATIKADGTIESVEITKSSGHQVLDRAAMRIVHMAAPYPPFPEAVRENWDQWEIIRTWRFDISGLSTRAGDGSE